MTGVQTCALPISKQESEREYLVIWFGEQKDDYRIKKYISAQELRELVKEGKKLEDELMKLYETRKKR